MSLTFEWDKIKAAANERKHGVSFPETSTIFGDEDAITVPDPKHSSHEIRKVTIGTSCEKRILVAVHTERGDNIRIINSRVASKKEGKQYNDRKKK